MNWPFVSRALLDEAHRRIADEQARHEQQAESMRADLRAERQRYDDLLEKFTALRVQGAVPEPKPVIHPVPAVAVPADPLRDLIAEVCAGDYDKQRIMLRQLAVDRANRVDEGVIRAAILNGMQSEGVPV